MAIITKKYQSTINNKTLGKTYSRVVHTETMSLADFSKHIASHGSSFDRATIQAVLMSVCDCLVEMTLDSKKVNLGDLGTFYMSAQSTGEENAANYSADNVKRLFLRFAPNQKRSYPLDGLTNRAKAVIRDLDTIVGNTQTSSAGGSSEEPVILNP